MWTEGKMRRKNMIFKLQFWRKRKTIVLMNGVGRIDNEVLSQSCLWAPFPRKQPIVLISSFRKQPLYQVLTVNMEHRLWTQCFCSKLLSHGGIDASSRPMPIPSGAKFKHHAILLASDLANDMVVVSLAQDSDSHWLARSSLGRITLMLTPPD